MLYPDLESFKTLSLKGNLIPVYREILADTETPVSATLKLGGSPSFLLESMIGGEKWARYSFLGSSTDDGRFDLCPVAKAFHTQAFVHLSCTIGAAHLS